VTDHGDQLRDAFRTHEDQTPDPAAVYARVRQLSQTYKRRRRGYQAAGGAVLGAGLIAGAFQLPALLPASHDSSAITMAAPAATSPSVVPSPSLSPTPAASPTMSALDKQYQAYFGAGYDYADAVKLAKLWKMDKNEIDQVKAKAGKLLLDGKKLPSSVKPDPVQKQSAQEEKRVNAFFDAGYDVDDAIQLKKIWKTKDAYAAKVLGGKKLLAGDELPIQP
jgi:hypothetical protein